MKRYNKWIFNIGLGLALTSIASTSCVDEIKFGDAFLEKAPGGTVTKDTVFNSAEYTQQFLNNLYGLQYYGLTYANVSNRESSNSYVGKVECLTDTYVYTYSGTGLTGPYFNGTHSANYGKRSDKFDYTRNSVWEAVRGCWLLIENLPNVPGLSDSQKIQMEAEAKCILASRYIDVFRHYGGVPIIKASFTGNDATYDLPRGSVADCVDFIVGLLDEAATVLPWTVQNPSSEFGRWTRAAALAYKCRILQFAASPIFNANEPYHPEAKSLMGDQVSAVWYGNYDAQRWTRLLNACQEFFNELNSKGGYRLFQAEGSRPEDYRLAFRSAYADIYSPEVLVSTRVIDKNSWSSSKYTWLYWQNPQYNKNAGRAYVATNEYMEMFPWADGSNFDWDETMKNGRGNEMFMKAEGTQDGLKNIELTRDPRLYETMLVNGLPYALDWTTGNMSGYSYELWVGGKHAGKASTNQNGLWATGYGPQKFIMGKEGNGIQVQWPSIRLAEMYYIYAEALYKTGKVEEAVKQIDIIRARVGMKGLKEANPSLNLSDDKVFTEELLRERACEFALEDARFYDLIRYKRADIFSKQLHGIFINRTDNPNTAWQGADEQADVAYPTDFTYEKYELTKPRRYWWTNGFDPKWYFSPFPATEINKGYGLIQNPGW